MKKYLFNVLKRVSVAMLVITMFGSPAPLDVSASEEKVVTTLNGKGYTKPKSLGDAANTVTALTSAVMGEHNGTLMSYSMTNGGYFNALDVVNEEVVYSELVEGVSQAWAHTIDAFGNVYIAALGPGNDGQLYRYKPDSMKLELLGTPAAGHQFWSITTDELGNVYIGTFKEGSAAVVKYTVADNKFTIMPVKNDKPLGYVRSIAYYDGHVYLGTGVTAKVIKMDVNTGECEDITKNAYDIVDKQGPDKNVKFVYDMGVANDLLITRFDEGGEGAILFYDLIKEEWVDVKFGKQHNGEELDFGAFGWNQITVHENRVIVTYQGNIHAIDLDTFEIEQVGGRFLGHRGGAIWDFGKGATFVSQQRTGEIIHFNLELNTKNSYKNLMKGTPLKIHNLGKDNYGDLYVTTYPGGPLGSKYNIKDEKYINFPFGQAEGIVAGKGDDMYFGIYPGAIIRKMNTKTQAVETLFELKTAYEQDRPYIMKYEDDLLMIGTIPDYKKLGGVLAIYNTITEELEVHRNVVQDQSIVGLAKHGNLIFGSTTTKGGLDVVSTAKKPVIFVWDIEKQEKIKEIEIPFEEIGETPMISGLTFDDKGQLWGAVDGVIFTMDPDTYEFTQHKDLYPSVKNRGMWRPVHIEFGEDGFVYTDIAGKLTVLDPSTDSWEHRQILTPKEVDFMTLSKDADGNEAIYIVQNDPTAIEEVKIIDVDDSFEEDKSIYAKVKLDTLNWDFEEEVVEGVIPGWSSLFADITPNVSFEISDEMVFEGKQSLKIVDGSDQETVFAISNPVAVEGGKTYTTDIMLYLLDGQNTLLMRYFDENGKQVGSDADGTNIIHIRGGYNKWQKVTATVEAPEGAKTVRIAMGSSKYFVTSGAYFDSAVTYSNEEVVALKLKALTLELAKFNDVDSKLYTPKSYAALKDVVGESKELLAAAIAFEESLDSLISKSDFEARILQDDVDSMFEKLLAAFNGLELKKDPVDPVDPIDPVDPVKPVDPDGELPGTGIETSYKPLIGVSILALGMGIKALKKKED